MTQNVIALAPLLYLVVAGTILGVRDSRWAFWLSIAGFWGGLTVPRIFHPLDEPTGLIVGIACMTILIAAPMGLLARAPSLASPPLPQWVTHAIGLGMLLTPPAVIWGLMLRSIVR